MLSLAKRCLFHISDTVLVAVYTFISLFLDRSSTQCDPRWINKWIQMKQTDEQMICLNFVCNRNQTFLPIALPSSWYIFKCSNETVSFGSRFVWFPFRLAIRLRFSKWWQTPVWNYHIELINNHNGSKWHIEASPKFLRTLHSHVIRVKSIWELRI